MFNNSKIIYGFNDLCVLPNVQNADRKVVSSIDTLRQKNGRSRFIITINSVADIEFAKSDRDHLYILKAGTLNDRLAVLLEREYSNIVPEFNIVEFIKEYKTISETLVQSKDRFNIIVNILDMTPLLFNLRSSELKDYLSMFNIVYRIYPTNDIINILIDMKSVGVIIDSAMEEVELKANASIINFASGWVMGAFPDRRFRDADMFEISKYGSFSVSSMYNEKDEFGIKSFALGSQFVIIDKPEMGISDTINMINTMEKKCLAFMTFLNSSKFSDIYNGAECCLISRY